MNTTKHPIKMVPCPGHNLPPRLISVRGYGAYCVCSRLAGFGRCAISAVGEDAPEARKLWNQSRRPINERVTVGKK